MSIDLTAVSTGRWSADRLNGVDHDKIVPPPPEVALLAPGRIVYGDSVTLDGANNVQQSNIEGIVENETRRHIHWDLESIEFQLGSVYSGQSTSTRDAALTRYDDLLGYAQGVHDGQHAFYLTGFQPSSASFYNSLLADYDAFEASNFAGKTPIVAWPHYYGGDPSDMAAFREELKRWKDASQALIDRGFRVAPTIQPILPNVNIIAYPDGSSDPNTFDNPFFYTIEQWHLLLDQCFSYGTGVYVWQHPNFDAWNATAEREDAYRERFQILLTKIALKA